MKKNIISGGAAVLFGLLIALGPQFIFKICEPADDRLMFCFWVGRAEIAVGILIAALGVAIILLSDVKIQLGLTLGIFMSAIVAISFPQDIFLDLCKHEGAVCQKVTFPALMVVCGLLAAGAVFNLIYLEKKTKS
ncbi:MAG: DUF4418 family protein [Treponema sp.]|nr:DUF4418 family protein [Treponema sp.]